MRFSGSVSYLIDIATRYIRAKVETPGLDDGNTRVDRQRRIVGFILFILFIGVPAIFLLLWTYFPDLAVRLFR